MSIRWSRIHAALGLPPQELTYDLVRSAVTQSLGEYEDLDWKRALPPDDERKKKDFAKDVAAMANTRGGLIVFGVQESNEQAAGLVPVANTESDRQRLRMLAHHHIRPLVAGLQIIPLDEEDQPGLLVISVPASPDAPHIVGEQNQMGVPFRDGSTTRWMSEYQLERAYAERRDRQTRAENALNARLGDLQAQVSSGLWFALASQPATPVSSLLQPPGAAEATETVQAATKLAFTILPAPERRGDPREVVLDELNLSPTMNPRIGLRRWIFTRTLQRSEQTDRVHIEVYHGGEAVLACAMVDGEHMREVTAPTYVAMRDTRLESAVVDGLALAVTSARERGCVGTVAIKAAVLSLDNAAAGLLPIQVTRRTRHEGLHLIDEARWLTTVKEVTIEVRADTTADELRDVAQQVVEDILHQFGIAQLMLLRPPPQRSRA